MEIWDELFKLYDAWKYAKRVPNTTEQQDKDLFYKQLDSKFLLKKQKFEKQKGG